MANQLGAAPIRVLIVEDNRDICGNIATYLEKHSYVLDFAYDGLNALHLALSNTYDVIGLDLMLPRMDGLSVCRKLRTDRDIETRLQRGTRLMINSRGSRQEPMTI